MTSKVYYNIDIKTLLFASENKLNLQASMDSSVSLKIMFTQYQTG
jgi:hypothetical protein